MQEAFANMRGHDYGRGKVKWPRQDESFSTYYGSDSADESLSGHSVHRLQASSHADVYPDFQAGRLHPVGPQIANKVAMAPVLAHMPCDFASSWNAAASASGWKREEPDSRPKNRRSNQKPKKVPQATEEQQRETLELLTACEQQRWQSQQQESRSSTRKEPPTGRHPGQQLAEMPLPKWCSGQNNAGHYNTPTPAGGYGQLEPGIIQAWSL